MTESNEIGPSVTDSSIANSPTPSPTESGKSESRRLNTQQQATKTSEVLDKFETDSGLGIYGLLEEIENEADRLLNLTRDQIRQMTALECSEAAYALEQFAFHLQRGINRQQSLANWAEQRVTRLIAPFVHQIPAYSPGERKATAIQQNDAAKETESVRVSAQLKVDRLSYLPGRVASLAKQMADISYNKRSRQ